MHHKNTKRINIHTDTIIFLFEIAILRFFLGGCTTILKNFLSLPQSQRVGAAGYVKCGFARNKDCKKPLLCIISRFLLHKFFQFCILGNILGFILALYKLVKCRHKKIRSKAYFY